MTTTKKLSPAQEKMAKQVLYHSIAYEIGQRRREGVNVVLKAVISVLVADNGWKFRDAVDAVATEALGLAPDEATFDILRAKHKARQEFGL